MPLSVALLTAFRSLSAMVHRCPTLDAAMEVLGVMEALVKQVLTCDVPGAGSAAAGAGVGGPSAAAAAAASLAEGMRNASMGRLLFSVGSVVGFHGLALVSIDICLVYVGIPDEVALRAELFAATGQLLDRDWARGMSSTPCPPFTPSLIHGDVAYHFIHQATPSTGTSSRTWARCCLCTLPMPRTRSRC